MPVHRPGSAGTDGLGTVLHTGPFHTALRAAIRKRGLTLERLRSRLVRRGAPVALSSLSDWQHGRSRPERANSVRAVTALEEILGLPRGALMTLLAARRGTNRGSTGPRRLEGLDEHTGPLADLLDSLPDARRRDVDILSRQERAVVDTYRHVSRMRSRTVLRARRDGIDRYVVRFFGDPGCVIDDVVVRPLENCRLGRVRRHPHVPVMIAELLFDQVLAAGETWIFDNEVLDETGAVCTEHAHGFRHSVRQYLMEVRFHPDALPTAGYAYAQASLDDEPHRTADLALSSHHTLHLVATDVTAGVLGIGWEWS